MTTLVKTFDEMKEMFNQQIEDNKVRYYEKTGLACIREAISGEVETTNVAKEGDYVIRSVGINREQYIVSKKKIENRYELLSDDIDEDGFKTYKATGRIFGFQYTGIVTFRFKASWGELMLVNDGHYICTPDTNTYDDRLPKVLIPMVHHKIRELITNGTDIYRIEQNEFKRSYKEI